MITVKIESLSGILPDCFKSDNLTSSVLQKSEGRIIIFELEIAEDIPIIKFIKALADCKYVIYEYSLDNKTITLRERN